MAAHVPASGRQEAHYAVPQCLLQLRDRADAHREFDGEGIQLWLDYELEALRFGVDPNVSREELAALVEGLTVLVSREEHRVGHANDFVRWGRRGGLATLRRYGTSWFSLLARRRWERLTEAELEQVFASINGGAVLMAEPLFPLGRLVATPGALALIRHAGERLLPTLLERHRSGDWGEVPAEDVRENEVSVRHGFRIISSYWVAGERLWIITERDRSATTLLLPSEY